MLLYSVISPYFVPVGASKRVNAGDGFILDSATKLIGSSPAHAFSSWSPITNEDLEKINSTSFLAVVGANSLKDDFNITPNFDIRLIEKITVPIFLFGLGHYGISSATQGLSPQSKTIFSAILERTPYISVRCEESRNYLSKSLPEFSDRILVTSCPVVFPVDGIDRGFNRRMNYNSVVLTITDRCLVEEQLPMFGFVKKLFPSQQYIVAFHQNYGNAKLYEFARRAGFDVFISDRYQDFLSLYALCDVHFGNRVHAHLKCLSYGTLSFCAPFDLRQQYFAESLGFPLVSAMNSDIIFTYDFAEFRNCRNRYISSLEKFIQSFPSWR